MSTLVLASSVVIVALVAVLYTFRHRLSTEAQTSSTRPVSELNKDLPNESSNRSIYHDNKEKCRIRWIEAVLPRLTQLRSCEQLRIQTLSQTLNLSLTLISRQPKREITFM